MLLPMDEVARSGHSQACHLAVPLGIHHDVGAILCHTDARVFASAWYLVLCLGVVARIHDGCSVALEMEPVGAGGIADARGAPSDSLSQTVFCPVEDCDAAIDDGGCRVESVAVLPRDGCMAHGAKEDGGSVGRDDRIDAWGTVETCPRPALVGLGGGGKHTEHQERQEKKFSRKGFDEFFHILFLL